MAVEASEWPCRLVSGRAGWCIDMGGVGVVEQVVWCGGRGTRVWQWTEEEEEVPPCVAEPSVASPQVTPCWVMPACLIHVWEGVQVVLWVFRFLNGRGGWRVNIVDVMYEEYRVVYRHGGWHAKCL